MKITIERLHGEPKKSLPIVSKEALSRNHELRKMYENQYDSGYAERHDMLTSTEIIQLFNVDIIGGEEKRNEAKKAIGPNADSGSSDTPEGEVVEVEDLPAEKKTDEEMQAALDNADDDFEEEATLVEDQAQAQTQLVPTDVNLRDLVHMECEYMRASLSEARQD